MAKKPIKIKVEDIASDEIGAGVSASKRMREDQDEELVLEDETDAPVPKSSCALWSIFLALFIIFCVIVGSLFYLKTKKFNSNVPKTNLNINSPKQASLPGEEVTLKLTEAQIQSAIDTNNANFPLKKAKVEINSDKIVLSGKTSSNFWGVSVEVGLVPKVDNGKVKFDIVEVKSAGVAAPKSISDMINQNLGQYLDGLSSSVGDIEVSKVELNEGYISVEGRQK